LSWFEEVTYRMANGFNKLLASPKFQPMMKLMGSVDSFWKVTAGRQLAAQRAVEDAILELGETRPLTNKGQSRFAEIVTERKKVHMLDIFAEDGLTLIDDEAKEMADMFTFQKTVGETDFLTKKVNELASFPGARMMGLTFIKTPSEILKASARFTPFLGSALRAKSKKYQNGSAYYRAMREGMDGASYVLGTVAAIGGATGNITGAGPLNYADNQTWRMAGNKPFTVKIPALGFEFNYSALEPISTPVGFIADMASMLKGDLRANPLSLLGSNVVNKSYLKQISTLAQMISMNDNDLKKLGAGIAGNLVPGSSFRRQTSSIADPIQRETRAYVDTSWQDFFYKNAGFGFDQKLPPRLNSLTAQPIKKNGMEGAAGVTVNAVNASVPFGAQIGVEQGDKTFEALYKYGVNINDPRYLKGPSGNINLDNNSITDFIKIRAQNGGFKRELDKYLFGDSEQFKLDKEVTDQMLKEGFPIQQTPINKKLSSIISYYNTQARQIMTFGDSPGSAMFRQKYREAEAKVNNSFLSNLK
jgi:hypothetical protein